MLGRSSIVFAVLVTACTSSPPAPGIDGGGSAGAGVAVSWRSTPSTFPSSLEDNLTLTHVTFAGSLDVVGNAGPGDPRTTEPNLDLEWGSAGTPPPTTFADAPSGPYSTISLALDGRLFAQSVELKGTYDGIDFDIADRSPFPVSLQIDRTLQAGGSLNLGVKIDFQDALSSIDWANVPLDDGSHYEIHDGQALQSFLAKLAQDIEIDDSVE